MASSSTYPTTNDGDLRALVPSDTTPSGFKDFTELLADAVAKIETELGLNPSGSYSTVALAIAAALDFAGVATDDPRLPPTPVGVTTGYIAKVSSGAIVWGAAPAALPSATTKGTIAVYNGTAWTVLTPGSDGKVLKALASESTGLKWDTASAGAAQLSDLSDGASVVYLSPDVVTADTTIGTANLNRVLEVSSGSAKTITVPLNATTALPVGFVTEVYRAGAGTVTIAPESGVTIHSPGGLLDIGDQYGSVVLRKSATDVWALAGSLA